MAGIDLEDIYDRYEDVWREGANRWRNAYNGIRAGTYDPNQLFRDVLYLWVEGTIGPWVPPAFVPNLRMSIPAADSEAFGSKWVLRQGGGNPTVPAPLTHDAGSGNGDDIPVGNVTAVFTQNDKVLVVHIEYGGLTLPPAGSVYSGVVRQGGNDLVRIRARVTP